MKNNETLAKIVANEILDSKIRKVSTEGYGGNTLVHIETKENKLYRLRVVDIEDVGPKGLY